MSLRARPAFSLIEMLVAMTLTLAVFAITLPFVRAQTRSLGSTAGRLDADQVARFAMRAVEQDLRRAAGEFGQPTIVAAGAMVLSFNANLRRADSLDVGALETETIGMAGGGAWPVSRAAAIPTTARTYPPANYVNRDGDTTRTETVTYFLQADTAATEPDRYTLLRQFNDQAPTALISGLYLPDSQPFFSYYRNVNNRLAEIPDDSVIFWSAPRMAEIRTIGLRASGIYVNKFDGSEFVRTIETRVTLVAPSATTAVSCGAAPAAPSGGLGATASSQPRGASLAWNRSGDDAGTPTGVLTYRIDRRLSGGAWGPVAVINASGANAYAYVDPLPAVAATFEYGVVALGCGGTASSRATLGSVTP